jgi:hypothetical protein
MGNTSSPAVSDRPQISITLVSRRFDAIRHTLKRMPSNMKGTDTFSFIIPVFYVVT